MKMSKIFIVMLGVIVVGIFVWKGLSDNNANASGRKEILQTEGLTTVKLSASSNGIYSPQLIKVKLGTKVRIEGDIKTLSGSMDTVIVDGYNISKKISADNNVLEFEANKLGQYRVHCANNMGNSKLIVE